MDLQQNKRKYCKTQLNLPVLPVAAVASIPVIAWDVSDIISAYMISMTHKPTNQQRTDAENVKLS